MAAEKLSAKGQAWFCTSGLPSDIVIEVEEMTFHLHKYPLMAKSRKLFHLIAEQEANPSRKRSADEGITEEEEEDGEICRVSLPAFPGGSEAFEAAAKFCYGVRIELTASNVAALRCAAEFLEMTEEFAEENLISKTERFLTQSVFRSIRDCVETLKSCGGKLMPLAESLSIPRRCVDSIAAWAAAADPASSSTLFGWPVSDGDKAANEILWNGIDTGVRRKKPTRRSPTQLPPGADSWFDDLTGLSLPLYKQLILAMKARDLSSDVIEGALMAYAKRSIPGLSRSSRKHSATSTASELEQRELLETVIENLPSKSRSATAGTGPPTRFLFGLLRTANILRASEESRAALERRIGQQLEQATLDDLLMPSYSYLIETLYDVDCVERILTHFLEGLDEGSTAAAIGRRPGGLNEEGRRSPPPINPVILVGKLMDGYLAEIASDANLEPEKFHALAVALPDHARLFDDGLYRAVDIYLKAHPRISLEEREKLCGVMDCHKLTLEACTHAAQNERLPLRAVVQVLFLEQLQLRHAIAGSILATDATGAAAMPLPPDSISARPSNAEEGGGDSWLAAVRENQVLRLDMDSMRTRVHELERECSTMRKAIVNMDKSAAAAAAATSVRGGGNGGGGWSLLTKKFGCKFKTQVCDSHERTVVEPRKGRQQPPPQDLGS